ncbi:MAG: hypothetical protein AB7S77_18850 [Desulfatirhabdiaceae bacterium]
MNPSIHPVWFPFTWISSAGADALQAVISKLTVFQISDCFRPELKHMADNPFVDIYIPFSRDCAELENRVLAYQKWMETHSDQDMTFLKAGLFANHTSEARSSDIRSDIIHYGDTQTRTDTLMAARVFLSIAEAFDCQQADISNDLIRFQELEKQFLEQFSCDGETPDFDPGPYPITADKPENHMLEERLNAWSTLFLHDAEINGRHDPDLFVTNSALAKEIILDKIPDMACIADRISVPAPEVSDTDKKNWRRTLAGILEGLITNPDAKPHFPADSLPVIAGHPEVYLTLYMAFGKTPKQVFGRFSTGFHQSEAEGTDSALVYHTLILVLETAV